MELISSCCHRKSRRRIFSILGSMESWSKRQRRAVTVSRSVNYILFVSFFIPFTEAFPSRHVNGDKIHHYSRQLAAAPPEPKPVRMEKRTTTTAASVDPGPGYVIYSDQVTYQPAYEPVINPFLSHMEQGWKLKPVRHKTQKKKEQLHSAQSKMKEKALFGDQLYANSNLIDDEIVSPLPVDPSRPHFVDSNEAWDTAGEDNRAFGNGEKDLRDLFSVLFSDDYNM